MWLTYRWTARRPRAAPAGCSQAGLRQGQTVVAVGYPGTASRRANLVPTTRVISVVRTRFDLEGVDVPQYPNVVQTDAAINPGDSGGPQGYAIGVDRVKEVVPRLPEGHSIGWTGMNLTHVADPSADAAKLTTLRLSRPASRW